MHEGKLTRGQLQAWALNRYTYQSQIPIKDASILARSDDSDFRRAWRKRILDHDGDGVKAGGIEKWLRLVEATGLQPEQAIRGEGILPATRYAVESYVHFVRSRTFLEAVASSLTELFSGKLITLRMDRLRHHYPWLSSGLDYFRGANHAGTGRREFRAGVGGEACANPARTGASAGGASRQVRYSVGDAGRALFCVRVAGMAATGRVSPGRERRVKPEMNSRPHLAPGCRLNEKDKPPRMLLMPERALRLNGPSLEIVERCDGCAYRTANYFRIAANLFEGRARESGTGHSGVSGPAEHAARAGL